MDPDLVCFFQSWSPPITNYILARFITLDNIQDYPLSQSAYDVGVIYVMLTYIVCMCVNVGE